MSTFQDKQQKALLRKFHTLLRLARVSADGKAAILHSYGVESGADLTVYELMEICTRLDRQITPDNAALDRWRKLLIGAVSRFLRAQGKSNADNLALIKTIACRAAQTDHFNSIPLDRLRSLYNAFNHRARDLQAAAGIDPDAVGAQTLS